MNSQVKLVSCTSLEDKAKEYAASLKIDKDYPLSLSDVYYDGEGNPLTIANMFPVIYKQAIKDLMERANDKSQPGHERDDGSDNVVRMDDLKQAAEDLIKEGNNAKSRP